MTEERLQDKAVSGLFWSGIGRFGAIALNFLSNLVLARLLLPGDFGAIGMLYLFIALSNEFVMAGFGTALVQKKHPTQMDFTSVFWWNLTASIVLYFILFFSAPAIARFYAMPELCPILRVQGVSTIILAFSVVPAQWLQKYFHFRELSVRQLLAAFVGTIVGIAMALLGYGVWSLVFSNLLGSLAGVLLMWRSCTWRPSWSFSLDSLKELFRFGGLMALSSLMGTFYSSLQGLIIGKRYSSSELGYYTQAQKLESVPIQTLSNVINQVTYPLFSELQDEKERLRFAVQKNIQTSCYVVFPSMALLAVVARPLITLLYGVKWEPSVPYFQLLCLCGMINPLNALNVNVPKSLGRSDLFFFSHLLMRVLGCILIILASSKGVLGLIIVVVALEYLFLLVYWIINKRLIAYGMAAQVKDVGFYYLLSLVLAFAVYWAGGLLPVHPYVTMFLQVLVYGGLYLLISHLLRLEGYVTCREIVARKIFKNNEYAENNQGSAKDQSR